MVLFISVCGINYSEYQRENQKSKIKRTLILDLGGLVQHRTFSFIAYSATHGISFTTDLCITYQKRPVIFVKSSRHHEKIVIIPLQGTYLIDVKLTQNAKYCSTLEVVQVISLKNLLARKEGIKDKKKV